MARFHDSNMAWFLCKLEAGPTQSSTGAVLAITASDSVSRRVVTAKHSLAHSKLRGVSQAVSAAKKVARPAQGQPFPQFFSLENLPCVRTLNLMHFHPLNPPT